MPKKVNLAKPLRFNITGHDRVPVEFEAGEQTVPDVVADFMLVNPSLGEVLGEADEDDSTEVRRQAARSLGERGDSSATPVLIQALQADRALSVRQEAAVSLGKVGGVLAKEALTYFAANSKHARLRRTSADALADIKPEKKPAPEEEKEE